MNRFKLALLPLAMLVLSSCSTRNKEDRNDTPTGETENLQLDTVGLQGEWTLDSYSVDCATTQFEAGSRYILSFDEPENSFGMTTDCNSIGGEFIITNDTIRFRNIAVTEMACDNMTVEENMLRLFNDTTAYAVSTGDSIMYTSPSAGKATFIRLPAQN